MMCSATDTIIDHRLDQLTCTGGATKQTDREGQEGAVDRVLDGGHAEAFDSIDLMRLLLKLSVYVCVWEIS